MTADQISSFLVPDWNDPMQRGFAIAMTSMVAFCVVSAHVIARPRMWERKWIGTPDDRADDLDIEHGSVTDLWHAVATWPEKLSEVMPGMLLVVGLLGTFIGLGLALNSAANVLARPDALDAAGASNAMQDVLAMLNGLGTKFKTSIWGIAGFILLKVWSEIARFEEKRMTWVIRRVKTELDQRKRDEKNAKAQQTNSLYMQIQVAANSISDRIGKEFAQAMQQERQITAMNLKKFDGIRAGLETRVAESTAAITQNIREGGHGAVSSIRDLQALIGSASKETREDVQECLRMQTAELRSALTVAFQQSTDQILTSSHTLHRATESIAIDVKALQTSLAHFNQRVPQIVDKMALAGDSMAIGADKVGASATALGLAIENLQSQFSSLLQQVGTNLSNAITEMSESASSVLQKSSSDLSNATESIATALRDLAEDVDRTLASIEKAQNTQTKAFNEFTATSQALNKNIEQSTLNIDKLTNAVLNKLGSVSEVGKQLRVVIDSLERFPAVTQKIEHAQLEAARGIANTASGIENLREVLSPFVHRSVGVAQNLESLNQASAMISLISDKMNLIHQSLEAQSARLAAISSGIDKLGRNSARTGSPIIDAIASVKQGSIPQSE